MPIPRWLDKLFARPDRTDGGVGVASPRNLRPGLSMQTTAICAVLFLVTVSTAICGYLSSYLSQRALERTLKRDARMLTETASRGMAEHLQNRDLPRLRRMIDDMSLDQRISFIALTDDSGKTLVRRISDPDGWWRYLQRFNGDQLPTVHLNQALILHDPGRSPLIVHIQPIWDKVDAQGEAAITPVSDQGAATGTRTSVLRGYLVTAMEDQVISQMSTNLRSATMALACVVSLIALPLIIGIVRLWSRPLTQMTEQATRLADGLSVQPVKTHRRDEVGMLASAFNTMVERLSLANRALRRTNADLEAQVEERTDQLQQAVRQLQAQVLTDPLTQLANRRCIEQTLDRTFAEAHRYDSDLTCVMIDLDRFKQMNDSLGHQAGDRLLQLAARVLNANCRRMDVAGRYGGDEFVLLLPRSDPDTALAAVQRIQEQFFRDVRATFGPNCRCGMSIGLASVSRNAPASADQLVALADAALYLAKAAGKGRIMFHPITKRSAPATGSSIPKV